MKECKSYKRDIIFHFIFDYCTYKRIVLSQHNVFTTYPELIKGFLRIFFPFCHSILSPAHHKSNKKREHAKNAILVFALEGIIPIRVIVREN